MANLFLRSTDGADADNGSTWALAKASIDNVDGITFVDAAGDIIYVSDNHAESTAGNVTAAFAGTLASPVQVLCVDDAGDPASPTTLANTGSIGVTGANDLTITGVAYIRGIQFLLGTTGGALCILGNTDQSYLQFNDCLFYAQSATSGARITIGSLSTTVESTIIWTAVDVRFSATTSYIGVSGGNWRWTGGSVLAVGSDITTLVTVTAVHVNILIENVDLTGCDATLSVFSVSAAGMGRAVIRNCKMPASWSGSVGTTPTGFNTRLELYNCDNADTNYRLWLRDYTGDVTSDDALYRAPGLGASSWMYNGTTQVVGISHKYATTANAEYPLLGLVGQELAGLNTTTDPTTSHVVTCYFTTPGQADFTPLSNKDIGLTVQYPGTAGSPLGKSANDLVANVLTAEADQDADTTGDWDDALGAWAASTAYSVGAVVRPTTRNGKTYYCSVAGTSHTVEPTWLTTEGGETSEGGGTAKWRCMHRQKMVVTLDATAGKVRERGWLHLTPVMYLASAVAWVDPQASVTSS